MPLFKIFLRDLVRTVHGNTRAKFEVHSFNRFGAINDRSTAHRHTLLYIRPKSARDDECEGSFLVL